MSLECLCRKSLQHCGNIWNRQPSWNLTQWDDNMGLCIDTKLWIFAAGHCVRLKIDVDLVFKHFLDSMGKEMFRGDAFVWLLVYWGYDHFTETDKRFNFQNSQLFKTIWTHFIYSHCARQWPTIWYCFMPFSTYYACMNCTDNTTKLFTFDE